MRYLVDIIMDSEWLQNVMKKRNQKDRKKNLDALNPDG